MTDQVSSDPRVGTELAGYRIERLLGRGGMSVVYLAEDTRLERKVALKLLAPELSEDEGFRERFLRESRLAASLDHPNVIPIFEAGEAEGVLFIAMRFVEGTDLRRLLAEEGKLDPGRAVAILERVAAALDVAHAQGLVHRDVKPGNVLIAHAGAEEHVYLSDFGLTKQAGSESGVTETGQFVGTADYVSPEQIERREVSAATDEYALACVLYECLTGSPPFPGGSLMGTLFGHLNDEARPAREVNPELPAEIDGVLAQGMAKEPERRYGTCGALVHEARSALALSGEIATLVVAPRRSRRATLLLAGLLVVLVVVAAVVAAVVLTGGGDDDPLSGESIIPPSVAQVDPETTELVFAASVGRKPADIAVGEQAVAVANFTDKTVSILDPTHAASPRTVAVLGTPTAVAVDGDSFWVTSTEAGGGRLSEIDANAARVSRSFDLELSDPVALAIDDGAVWAAGVDFGSNQILRIDGATGNVVASIPVTSRPVDVLGAHGAIWFTTTASAFFRGGASEGAGEDAPVRIVSKIDPRANEVVAEIQLPLASVRDSHLRLAAGAEAIWAGEIRGNRIWKIDPATNGVTATLDLEADFLIACFTFGEGSLWVTNIPAVYAYSDTLLRLDPSDGSVISSLAVPSSECGAAGAIGEDDGIAIGQGGMWVAVPEQDDVAVPQDATGQ